MKKCYTVSLAFDIKADSPREAAEKMQYLIRDVERFWKYEVINNSTKEKLSVDLDLDE